MFLPALMAIVVLNSPPGTIEPWHTQISASDSATLTRAVGGQRLEFRLRGAELAVHAAAQPAEGGCATLVSARTPDASGARTRLLRWADVAWVGDLPDGRVLVAFYEEEGRLPSDRVAFTPADPVVFRAALARVLGHCRGRGASGKPVMVTEHAQSRSCYFARHPALELLETGPTGPNHEPARAVITVLARETPEAELRLLVERADPAAGQDWARPEVAFTIAGGGFDQLQLGAVHFALDGAPVEARHSIAIYNDTRLRIRTDADGSRGASDGENSFYRRLAASDQATVTLLDRAGAHRAVFTFDAGAAIGAARHELEAAAWSCAAALPLPAPAAQWNMAE